MQIEICATNLQSALNAQAAGAHRIELCSNLELGGTTPSAGLIRMSRQSLHIPVHVLIRPRGGDFCYTQSELEVMRQDIRFCKSLGVHGVVIGLLTPDAKVDLPAMRHLVELARPMKVTFHRAFDQVVDPLEALRDIQRLGIDILLTSGQQATAWDGRELIRQLVQESDQLEVMPGSGIGKDNLLALAGFCGATTYHLSAKKQINSLFDPSLTDLLFTPCEAIPAFDRFETDPEKLGAIMKLVSTEG